MQVWRSVSGGGDVRGRIDGGEDALRRPVSPRNLRAFAVAVLIHAAVLLCLIQGRHPGGMIGGGADGSQATGQGPGVGALSVSLVPEASIADAKAAPLHNPDPLAAMMDKQVGNAPPTPVPGRATPRPSLDSLLAQADREAQLASMSPKAAHAPTGGSPASGGAVGKTAPIQGRTGAGADAHAGDLWSQIQPCWRRALQTSTVPVALEISLDSAGRLARAPKIMDVGRGAPEGQRISMERALQAVAACLPFTVLGRQNSQGVYKVEFGVSSP